MRDRKSRRNTRNEASVAAASDPSAFGWQRVVKERNSDLFTHHLRFLPWE